MLNRIQNGAYGSPIDIFRNDAKVATIPAGFRKFIYCLAYDEVDLKYDVFQFKSTGDDDVSNKFLPSIGRSGL